MKTGRLLKFPRPGVDVHAYIYRDGPDFRAAIYVISSERGADSQPLATLSSPSEAGIESAVRELVDARFPRPG